MPVFFLSRKRRPLYIQEMPLFPSILHCRFLFWDGVFLACDHGLDFDVVLVVVISLLYVRTQPNKKIPNTGEHSVVLLVYID